MNPAAWARATLITAGLMLAWVWRRIYQRPWCQWCRMRHGKDKKRCHA